MARGPATCFGSYATPDGFSYSDIDHYSAAASSNRAVADIEETGRAAAVEHEQFPEMGPDPFPER